MNEIIRPTTEIIKEIIKPTPENIAREILGKENFLGQEAFKKTFDTKLKPEQIAPIHFTVEQIQKAKELNQFLILRRNKAPDGQPLSMEKMNNLLEAKFQKEGKGKILYCDTSNYQTEEFYIQDTVRTAENYLTSWALVSKDLIPNSIDKKYLKQTEVIIDYLKNNVFKNQTLPKEYQKAIEQFNQEKSTIEKLISSDWQSAAKKLSFLKINQLTRQSPVEYLYDALVYFQNTGKRLLKDSYAWTWRQSSSGMLVGVGCFAPGGVSVSDWKPGRSSGYLSVLLQQSEDLSFEF